VETVTEIVKAKLPNGAYVHIETTILEGEEEVALTPPTFIEVIHVIEGIAESVVTALEKVKPQKAIAEFGLEVALESGKLTAMLVKGSGTAHLNITMEWENKPEEQFE
jgi:hypothetical protein